MTFSSFLHRRVLGSEFRFANKVGSSSGWALARCYCAIALFIGGCSRTGNAPSEQNNHATFSFAQAERPGAYPIVLVTINGRDYPFLLDTGTGYTIVDSRLRPYLTPIVGDEGGNEDACEYKPSQHEKTGFSLSRCNHIQVRDLSKLWTALQVECYGIVGVDALQQSVVRFDQTLRVVEIHDEEYSVRASTPHPITFDEWRRPEVRCIVGGRELSCVLDTGLLATVGLAPKDFALLDQAPGALRVKRIIRGTGGLAHAGICEGVNALGSTLHDCEVREFNFSAIGWYFLCRGDFTIDFRNQQAWFEPTDLFHAKDRCNIFGTTLSKTSDFGDFVFKDVASDGPAAANAIREGDLLRYVNGADVRKLDVPELIRRIMFEAGPQVEMGLLRNGEKFTVTFN